MNHSYNTSSNLNKYLESLTIVYLLEISKYIVYQNIGEVKNNNELQYDLKFCLLHVKDTSVKIQIFS